MLFIGAKYLINFTWGRKANFIGPLKNAANSGSTIWTRTSRKTNGRSIKIFCSSEQSSISVKNGQTSRNYSTVREPNIWSKTGTIPSSTNTKANQTRFLRKNSVWKYWRSSKRGKESRNWVFRSTHSNNTKLKWMDR